MPEPAHPVPDRPSIDELLALCLQLRATLRDTSERRRSLTASIGDGWLGPRRSDFDRGLADLDRHSAEVNRRLTSIITVLRERAADAPAAPCNGPA